MPFELPSLRAFRLPGSLWAPNTPRRPEPVPPSRAEQSLRALLAPERAGPGASRAARGACAPSAAHGPPEVHTLVQVRVAGGPRVTHSRFDDLAILEEGQSYASNSASARRTLRPEPPATRRAQGSRTVSGPKHLPDCRHVEVAASGLQQAIRHYARTQDGEALLRALKEVSRKLDAAPTVAPHMRARLDETAACLQKLATFADATALCRAQALLDTF